MSENYSSQSFYIHIERESKIGKVEYKWNTLHSHFFCDDSEYMLHIEMEERMFLRDLQHISKYISEAQSKFHLSIKMRKQQIATPTVPSTHSSARHVKRAKGILGSIQ